MRSRSFLVAAVAACLASAGATRAAAQVSVSDPMAGGLVPGDYLRLGAGYVSPVNPQGSLKEWKPGLGISAFWENWQAGQTGMGRVGFGLGASYAMLPLDEAQFKHDFAPTPGTTATSATANRAGVLEITTGLRVRLPAPYVVPTINFNFGFINWAPGKISYTASNGTTGTAQQQHRSGAEFAIGGGLDRNLFDRYAIFGEAMYTYGFTSYGQFAAPSGACLANTCDLLKNTTVATVRGGLRVRMGR